MNNLEPRDYPMIYDTIYKLYCAKIATNC